MPFPKLSHLQSRFAVSLGATFLLILIYLSLAKPSFAYAAELDTRIPPDHNHPITFEYTGLEDWLETGEDDVELHFERRAPDGVRSLTNNFPQNMNIESGSTEYWVFAQDQIQGPYGTIGKGLPSDATKTGNMSDDGSASGNELRKRQSLRQVWITINTCLQPTSSNENETIPPQLRLFYSTSSDNAKPDSTNGAEEVDVEGGYGVINVNATDDVYVGLTAPNTSLTGPWNYEIAASIDAPYHAWYNNTDLLFVDGDNHAALLVTPDLDTATSSAFDEWMGLNPAPYGVFAHDKRNQSILGVSRSYCGLLHNTRIMANIPDVSNDNVGTMTSRGLGHAPKEQFYLSALKASRNYYGWLAMTGNSTHYGGGVVGGGGAVWANMTFRTKSSDNCALMYNLTFCSEVAYAVPSNPQIYSPLDGLAELSAVYDNYASSMYQYFNYSLQQIPCNTTDTAQYSLARNCDDCAAAYKQWLCAVTIPRCEDWDNDANYLQPRLVSSQFTNGSLPDWINDPLSPQQAQLTQIQANTSRNAQIIDDIIKPGPYKEVLPCIDLCYDLVQSCPAKLGFGCPEGKYQNMSYGVRDLDPGVMRCSYLGAAYYLNEGVRNLRVLGSDKMTWVSLLITVVVLGF